MAKRRSKSKSRKSAARKGAATRARKRARRSAGARKAARTRARRGSKRGKRRSSRRVGARRGKRRSSARRRRASGRKHRPVVWKGKGGRFFQRRRGRLGLKGHRVNPPLIPTMGSVMSIVKDGAAGVGGFMGVNAVMKGAGMVGVDKLYAGQSPIVQGLIKTALRLVAVGLVAKVGGMVIKGEGARRAMILGAAINVVLNGVKDLAGDAVPAWGQDLLLGDGCGDYLTFSPNMADYMPAFPGTSPANALVQASSPGSEGLF